jgi:effector-binding domain-containing protein
MGEIEIADVEPLKVIGMRKTGRYDEIPMLFKALFEYGMANNIKLTGPAIYISHEMSEEEAMKAMAEGNADLEAAFPVVGDTAPESEEIKFYELPAAKVAKVLYKGPYDQIGPTYNKLFEWLKDNDKQIAGFFRECYLNDPNEVGMENALTEVQVPIE